MPIVIKSLSTAPNKTVTFDFPSNVLAYVVGVSYWNFSFGSDDHHVKKLILSLDSNQPGANQITTTVTAKIDDESGHGISSADSKVSISCIAVVTAADGNILLSSCNSIASGGSSQSFPLPGSSLKIGSTFITGFSLSQPTDHHVKTVQTTAGFKQTGNSGQITSQAQMVDTSGNFAEGSINGGLLAAASSEQGILSRALTNQQTDKAQSVDFGQALATGAAVLLQSLEVTFGKSDHHVKTIGGGCGSWRVEGTKVTLDNARAFITDDSGHAQDNGESNVSLVVFAVPA